MYWAHVHQKWVRMGIILGEEGADLNSPPDGGRFFNAEGGLGYTCQLWSFRGIPPVRKYGSSTCLHVPSIILKENPY